ncbi:hypothetical protein [Streptococcus sp. CSL10205-OR2]|uniref:hypothetical protein n=1 Tax=Streptococcus sp. CSL10205-OR2 TaxID=2980558 RepID=UPI0021D9C13A|nr:hypothetical protein [Streptococcus sp. CSL10205-OR2]MCU9533234.1 hypothetical protein [Streptococcus sp. CSL10205-OR2]
MKKFLITGFVAIGLLGLIGCSNNSDSSKSDISEKITSKKEEDNSSNISEKITKKDLKLTQKGGDDRVGYYDIPEDFFDFTDIDHPESDDIQYSDITTKNIITLNVIDTSSLSKEEQEALTAQVAADNIASYLQEDNNLEDIELFYYNEFQDKVYQDLATYKTGEVLSVNLFEHDGKIYYFAIEGSEEFVDTYWAPILDSFSTTK